MHVFSPSPETSSIDPTNLVERQPVPSIEPNTPVSPTYLVWYDPAPNVLPQDKLQRALDRHRERNGETARVVLCWPAQAEQLAGVTGIEIRPNPMVPPGYFWVGVA